MFVVTEVEATAIRTAFEQGGELSVAVELRRQFPLITDIAETLECARTIAGWKPLQVQHLPTPDQQHLPTPDQMAQWHSQTAQGERAMFEAGKARVHELIDIGGCLGNTRRHTRRSG
jgi:hypothetical protein